MLRNFGDTSFSRTQLFPTRAIFPTAASIQSVIFRVFWLTVNWSSKDQPKQAQKVIHSIVFQFNLNTADNNNANANTNNNNANIVNVMPPGKKKKKRSETGSQEETDRDRKCPRSRDRGLADASLATALLLQVDIFLALLNKTYPSYFLRHNIRLG